MKISAAPLSKQSPKHSGKHYTTTALAGENNRYTIEGEQIALDTPDEILVRTAPCSPKFGLRLSALNKYTENMDLNLSIKSLDETAQANLSRNVVSPTNVPGHSKLFSSSEQNNKGFFHSPVVVSSFDARHNHTACADSSSGKQTRSQFANRNSYFSNFSGTDANFKTAVQVRDPTAVKPQQVNIWDMLALQDTYNKKVEDQEYLRQQMQNNLKMRAFYEGQIQQHKKQRRDERESDANDRQKLIKNLEKLNREKAKDDDAHKRYRSEIATRNYSEGLSAKLKR